MLALLIGADGALLRLAVVPAGVRHPSQIDCARMAINCIANLCAKPGGIKLDKVGRALLLMIVLPLML